MRDPADRFWAVLPAGGSGARMGASLPKQYLSIGAATMLERSSLALLAADWIERVVVVIAPDDDRAQRLLGSWARVELLARGGATRRDSVLAGLHRLRAALGAAPRDWVLVHDAARPGVTVAALERLRDTVVRSDTGGLLALPVADTVKRARRERLPACDGAASDGEPADIADATLDRTGLWLAQTPQMFRLGDLIDALERHPQVTDEASAIEALGRPVLLIEGDRANFKVTTPDDLELMRRLLEDGR